MMTEHGIEIVGGLGDLAGEIFRVGCMGHSARSANAAQFVASFGGALATQGLNIDYDAGVAATARALP
jgi:alanine-glyoxylate transaminase/serine-glyoxylate transaminase/serine-pyruvate transaminase